MGKRRPFLVLTVIAACLQGPACAEPTQISFVVTTDVPCSAVVSTAISVGTLSASLDGKPADTESMVCNGGSLGTLVVIPSGDRGAELGVRIVTGTNGTSADQCIQDKLVGNCIVARRALHFIRHSPLTAEVKMTASCLGITCSPTQTCQAGLCVNANFECGGPCPSGADAGADVDAAPPADAGPPPLVAAIASAGQTTCAIGASGLKCWGANDWGDLGDGTTSGKASPKSAILPAGAVAAVHGGNFFFCAILAATGGVQCWGINQNGQLGTGQSDANPHPQPANVPGVTSGVIQLALGKNHACALLAGGTVSCWGGNDFGQLGIGTTDTVAHGVTPVPGLSGIKALGAGPAASFMCAIAAGGNVSCWGYGGFGSLGDGTTKNHFSPNPVPGLTGATAVTCGDKHTCVLLSSGEVDCFGANNEGELGDGTLGDRPTPGVVFGLSSGVDQISAGYHTTCVRLVTGGVKCWGENANWDVGDALPDASVDASPRTKPVDVSGLTSGVLEVRTVLARTCALLPSGNVKCWGTGGGGFGLGDGKSTGSPIPVDVIGLP